MKRRKGVILELFILLVPVFVALLGIVIDAGLMLYYQHQLDMATEAASVATISAYDRPVYEATSKVRIEQKSAENAARDYLRVNFKEAKIKTVESINEYTVKVSTVYVHEFVFMRLFGFEEVVLESECITIGG